jgi:hypothetical protein
LSATMNRVWVILSFVSFLAMPVQATLGEHQDSGLLGACTRQVLEALRTGQSVTTALTSAPASQVASPSLDSESWSNVPWIQHLVKVMNPLRAGGSLVELLQSTFLHLALLQQAQESGWNRSGRFTVFFEKLTPSEQIAFLRAVSLRVWVNTFTPIAQIAAPDVREPERLRYRNLLGSFLATNSDEIVHHFLARIRFESEATDKVVRQVIQFPAPLFQHARMRLLFAEEKGFTAAELNTTLETIATLDESEAKNIVIYWAALNRSITNLRIFDAQLERCTLITDDTRQNLARFTLQPVGGAYLATLEASVLKLRIDHLQWRLAMSQITSPSAVVGNYRKHLMDALEASRQGSSSATQVIVGVATYVLRYLGLPTFFNTPVTSAHILTVGEIATSLLPESVRQASESLMKNLNDLEENLTDWVRQSEAITADIGVEEELTHLQARLDAITLRRSSTP